MTVSVRRAASIDLGALVPLFDGYRQFYGHSSDLAGANEFLAARLTHSESVVFLARDEGTSVGFTQLYPSFSSGSMTRTFVLNDLYVEPRYRRRGIGEQLLRAAEGYARAVGATRLSLATALDNAAAQELYESAGWRRDDKFHVYHRHTRP